MRVHFQEKPWDLYVCTGYTLTMTGILLGLGTGDIFSLFMIIFTPGFVLVASLFPSRNEIDWTERIALSMGTSIAIVPLLGLALSFTPFGLRFAPLLIVIAMFTLLVGVVAHQRRMRLRVTDRLAATIHLSIPAWRQYSPRDKILVVSLGAGTVLAIAIFANVISTPYPQERFTEFYLLGADGTAARYPTRLNASEPGTVLMGIANHELARANYTVRVDVVGVRIVHNGTSGSNETVELNRSTWLWLNVTLGNAESWTQPYTFEIAAPGLWKIQFLLYKDREFSSAYRGLQLYITVM